MTRTNYVDHIPQVHSCVFTVEKEKIYTSHAKRSEYKDTQIYTLMDRGTQGRYVCPHTIYFFSVNVTLVAIFLLLNCFKIPLRDTTAFLIPPSCAWLMSSEVIHAAIDIFCGYHSVLYAHQTLDV